MTVALPDGADVAALLAELARLEPGLAAGLGSALPVVRGSQVDRGRPLGDGDDVALLIPVAGGAPGPAKPERRTRWQ